MGRVSGCSGNNTTLRVAFARRCRGTSSCHVSGTLAREGFHANEVRRYGAIDNSTYSIKQYPLNIYSLRRKAFCALNTNCHKNQSP